jgi:spore coat protein CotF
MKLAAHEAQELRELALSCCNSIVNMAYFRSHTKDPELRAMIERHFPFHVQDYNMKVEYLTKMEGAQTKLPLPDLNVALRSYTESPSANYSPVTPRVDVQDFTDQEIATAYLLTLKRAGREYAWAAMDASHPQIRLFLEDAFRMSCRNAYDVWQWMVKKGYYPVAAAPQQELQTMGQVFQTVQSPIGTTPMQLQ